jgi:hypothetical protein
MIHPVARLCRLEEADAFERPNYLLNGGFFRDASHDSTAIQGTGVHLRNVVFTSEQMEAGVLIR